MTGQDIHITERATAVLQRATDAAVRFNPEAKIRLHMRGNVLDTSFSDIPEEGDQIVEHEGLTLFVSQEVAGTIDASEEHERLVLK
ncbi:MAG TPA: hypothetical protein VNA87_04530 [Actinomycetota bacterium]|nr:hypothetical protein [Actinomycetota bacterium]